MERITRGAGHRTGTGTAKTVVMRPPTEQGVPVLDGLPIQDRIEQLVRAADRIVLLADGVLRELDI
jgi:hypothetical protein